MSNKTNKRRTSINVPAPLLANIDCLARIDFCSRSEMIRYILRRYVRDRGLDPDRRPALEMKIKYD